MPPFCWIPLWPSLTWLEVKAWRARTLIGGPVVLMKYSTPCLLGNVANWGVVICKKFESNLLYSLLDWHIALRCQRLCFAQWRQYVSTSTRRIPLRSTRSEFTRKKSAPSKVGNTSAMMKSHLYCFDGKQSRMVCFPYVFIVLPLATTSEVHVYLAVSCGWLKARSHWTTKPD